MFSLSSSGRDSWTVGRGDVSITGVFESEPLGSSGLAMVNFRIELGASLLVNEAASSSFGARRSTEGCARVS